MDIRAAETVMNLSPDSIFFIKDRSRQYLSCNQGLVQICGANVPKDILGRRTQDFFSSDLVHRYDHLDQDVYAGLTFLARLDFLHDAEGRPIWTLYSRQRVSTDAGETAVMGVSRKLPAFRNSDRVYKRLYIATEWIAHHLSKSLNVRELAERCDCSMSQIQRDFVNVLSLSPRQYQARLRLQRIKDKMRTDCSLIEIAMDCGFSEQSGLSRFFRKQTGMTLTDFKASNPYG